MTQGMTVEMPLESPFEGPPQRGAPKLSVSASKFMVKRKATPIMMMNVDKTKAIEEAVTEGALSESKHASYRYVYMCYAFTHMTTCRLLVTMLWAFDPID